MTCNAQLFKEAKQFFEAVQEEVYPSIIIIILTLRRGRFAKKQKFNLYEHYSFGMCTVLSGLHILKV